MLRRGFLRRSAVRCFKWDGGEKGNRMPDVVAAGTGATPAAFYLGLCRFRGNLSPPASATVILQAGRSSAQLRWCYRRAVLSCSSDDAASILNSGLEIKNHCTLEDISGQNMQRFPNSPLKSRITARWRPFPGTTLHRLPNSPHEIKNHCTLEAVSRQKPAVIPKFTP